MGKIENKNVNIITDTNGKKLVLINDIRFKVKARDDWKAIEEYLKEYIGNFYELEETSEKIYISADFPDEYANLVRHANDGRKYLYDVLAIKKETSSPLE